ncbi:MAG: NAD(P)/FAD-dependent oxidoreductase [Bradymonadaceae bacterium]
MSATADITVIGGGLAGLEFARRASSVDGDGPDLALVDAGGPRRGSDAPGVLLHPFPGRRIDPAPETLEQCQFSVETISEWEALAPRGTVRSLPMVRPFLEGDVGDDLRDSWRTNRDDLPSWVDAREVRGWSLGPLGDGFESFDGALMYRPARLVELPALRRALRTELRHRGADLRTGLAERLVRCGDDWRVETTAGTIESGRVVLAVGRGLTEWFPDLDLHGRGGELVVADPPPGVALRCIVNAGGGHVAPTRDGRWIAGSSWWRDTELFDRTDRQAIRAVGARCERSYPPYRAAVVHRVWRGIRAKYRDNRALVGPVPGLDDLYVLGAFGSKGVLRIPSAADRLAARLHGESVDLPPGRAADRVEPSEWRPAVARLEV